MNGYTTFCLFIHQFYCFHFGALMSNATMNICVQIFVWTYIFVSLGYIPRNGIIESYGKSLFNHLRNCQTVFQSVCIILHTHQWCTEVPLSHKPLLLSFWLQLSWYLIVALIYISLMTNDVQFPHVFTDHIHSDSLPLFKMKLSGYCHEIFYIF